jgi:hypothetical protein
LNFLIATEEPGDILILKYDASHESCDLQKIEKTTFTLLTRFISSLVPHDCTVTVCAWRKPFIKRERLPLKMFSIKSGKHVSQFRCRLGAYLRYVELDN